MLRARACLAAPAVPQAHLRALCRVVYTCTKLRGYKKIVKLFPHAVADLEPVLACLDARAAAGGGAPGAPGAAAAASPPTAPRAQ